jgi:hypothetical protein
MIEFELELLDKFYWNIDRYYPYSSVYLVDRILEFDGLTNNNDTINFIHSVRDNIDQRLINSIVKRSSDNKSVVRFTNEKTKNKHIFMCFYDNSLYIGASIKKRDSGIFYDLINKLVK